MRVKCLAHEHNAMSLARAGTRTAQSRDKHTNHEATVPPCSLQTLIKKPLLKRILKNLPTRYTFLDEKDSTPTFNTCTCKKPRLYNNIFNL